MAGRPAHRHGAHHATVGHSKKARISPKPTLKLGKKGPVRLDKKGAIPEPGIPLVKYPLLFNERGLGSSEVAAGCTRVFGAQCIGHEFNLAERENPSSTIRKHP